MTDLFTEKFAPQSFKEFVGNSKIVGFVKKWAQNWSEGIKGKPLLLHGSPGIGKTALAFLVAKEFNWQLFELNASDFRNKDIIDKVVGGASLNASFFSGKRLILLDEVDGIQKREDRGGLQAITQILKDSQQPIILTANKIFFPDRKLDSIKFSCEELKFSKISFPSIAKRLKEICEKQGIDFDQEVLKKLAEDSNGDLRAALLDLQNLSIVNNKIVLQDLELNFFRERETDVFQVVEKIFKKQDLQEIRKSKAFIDIDNDLLKKWVEENIPRIYLKGEDSRKAFEVLSRADVFDGRIMRRQHWGFLRYSSELMSSGVALAKENEYHGWLQLQFPSFLKKLSSSTALRNTKKAIALKIGEKIHSSSKEVIKNDLEFIKTLMQNKKNAVELTTQFDFDEKELSFLLNAKPDSKSIEKILFEAQELKKKFIKPVKLHSFESFEQLDEFKELEEKRIELENEKEKLEDSSKEPSQTKLF